MTTRWWLSVKTSIAIDFFMTKFGKFCTSCYKDHPLQSQVYRAPAKNNLESPAGCRQVNLSPKKNFCRFQALSPIEKVLVDPDEDVGPPSKHRHL